MKKISVTLIALCLLAFASPSQAEQVSDTQQTRITQLNGKVWQNSAPENKLSMLYGMALMVDIERATQNYFDRTGKKSTNVLSPFEKAWLENFTSVRDLAKQIDAWYESNPDKLEYPVVGVIAHGIMKLPTSRAAK